MNVTNPDEYREKKPSGKAPGHTKLSTGLKVGYKIAVLKMIKE
jgi:hypothetical protein